MFRLDPLRVNIAVRRWIIKNFRHVEGAKQGMKDILVVKHLDKDGKVLGVREVIDIVTNKGLAEVAGLFLLDIAGTTKFDYVGIGTSDATAQATNDSLTMKVKVKAATGTRQTTNVTNDTAQLVATFSSADGLSGSMAIKEADVQNMSTTGITFCRQTFAALNVNWTSGDSIEITEKTVMTGA